MIVVNAFIKKSLRKPSLPNEDLLVMVLLVMNKGKE